MLQSNNRYIDINTGQIYESAESALEAQRMQQKEEQAKKNPPFIQLYKGVSPKIIQNITREYPIATEIFMFFLDYMDNDNVIAVSQSVIAESIDRTRQTVSKGLKVLEKHGAIWIGKIGRNSVYIINTEMAWQKAYHDRRFAKMKGSFILGEDENKKMFDKFRNVTDSIKIKGKNGDVKNVLTKTSIIPPKNQQPKEQTNEIPLSVEELNELQQEQLEAFEQQLNDEE